MGEVRVGMCRVMISLSIMVWVCGVRCWGVGGMGMVGGVGRTLTRMWGMCRSLCRTLGRMCRVGRMCRRLGRMRKMRWLRWMWLGHVGSI